MSQDYRIQVYRISQDTDKKKEAFSRGGGLQITLMPFGLCNAPVTFERVLDTVL